VSRAEAEVALPDGVALHARPAADFVKVAQRFAARVEVRANGREADAKSLLAVLALGAKAGTSVRLAADGGDAAAAVGGVACVL
jgi:phosphotransferase system HPr (HPr) family protein